MSNEAHVALTDVVKIFSLGNAGAGASVQALGPLELALKKGEFFSVIGPSGCGKSTLLEIIAGLSGATSGEVLFDGMRLNAGVPPNVGVVFQEDASFPWLTVRNNIAFGLKRRGMPAAEIKTRVDKALELVGLKDFSSAYPSQLSGGMRQRVCIARTIVLEPELILLDEPFGALDQQTRLLMSDEILRIWRETGTTIFLITHSLDEATLLSDRIGVMSARPGRFLEIIETGWPRERDSRIVSQERFGVINAHLWELLRAESLKAVQPAEA